MKIHILQEHAKHDLEKKSEKRLLHESVGLVIYNQIEFLQGLVRCAGLFYGTDHNSHLILCYNYYQTY